MIRDDLRQKRWLTELGKRTVKRLRETVNVDSVAIVRLSEVVAWKTETDGWLVELGRVRGDRGSALQIWLDRWTRKSTRKLYIGYKGTRTAQVKRAAAAGTQEFGAAHTLRDDAYAYDEEAKAVLLKKPLQYFGVPIAEFYTGVWSFYGVYLLQTPEFTAPPSTGVVNTTLSHSTFRTTDPKFRTCTNHANSVR